MSNGSMYTVSSSNSPLIESHIKVLQRENEWMRKCLEDEVRDGTNRMMRSRRDGFLTGMLFGFGFGLIFGYAIFLLIGETYGM